MSEHPPPAAVPGPIKKRAIISPRINLGQFGAHIVSNKSVKTSTPARLEYTTTPITYTSKNGVITASTLALPLCPLGHNHLPESFNNTADTKNRTRIIWAIENGLFLWAEDDVAVPSSKIQAEHEKTPICSVCNVTLTPVTHDVKSVPPAQGEQQRLQYGEGMQERDQEVQQHELEMQAALEKHVLELQAAHEQRVQKLQAAHQQS